jgi:hypothetical protein
MINLIWDWIVENKVWVFSGAGIAIIGGIFTLIKWLLNKNKRDSTVNQSQKSGKNSINIQVVGDLTISGEVKNGISESKSRG